MMLRLPRWLIKFGLNLYGPYLGAGVRVKRISADWLEMDLAMKLRWYNRNVMGVQFGGSLYSMIDPHFVLLLMKKLGPGYTIWDREAHIEFLRPGRTEVYASIRLSESQVEQIRTLTCDNEACQPEFQVEIFDTQHELVARARKTLHIRHKSTESTGRSK